MGDKNTGNMWGKTSKARIREDAVYAIRADCFLHPMIFSTDGFSYLRPLDSHIEVHARKGIADVVGGKLERRELGEVLS